MAVFTRFVVLPVNFC